MSRRTVAAVICEGQTDFPVLSEVISELWPGIEILALQPVLDETGRVAAGRSAGWTEVKAWCDQHAEHLDEVLDPFVGNPIDLLLVAIDMDIALKAGIADPPREVGVYESPRLREKIESWLKQPGHARLPSQIVISTPVLALETWIVAALFPKQTNLESLPDPAQFLLQRKKLRPSPKDGSPWKELHLYRDFAIRVAKNLARVRQKCSEADRTCREIETRRSSRSTRA